MSSSQPTCLRRAPDPFVAACPSRRIIELIGDKWALLVLPALKEGPKRNGELMRRIEGISQKMLTQTLRDLERNNLVERRDMQTVPPHVEDMLTDLGRSLDKVLDGLNGWIAENLMAFDNLQDKDS